MPTARKPVTKGPGDELFDTGRGFPGDDDYEEGDWESADSLLGPLVRSVSFPEIGSTITGTVTNVTVGQNTDLDGAPRTFDNGEIRMQVVVTLQTDLEEDDDDDGLRKLYVRGKMVKSFRNELRRNKVKGLRPGGILTVAYREDEEPTRKGYNPAKLFDVVYEPPVK